MNLFSIPLKLGVTSAILLSNETENSTLAIYLSLVFCLVVILAVIVFLILNNYYLSNGIIPNFWKKKEKHLVDIYARLSGILILNDRREINEKINFISKQLSLYFPEQKKQDFRYAVRFSLKNPVQIESVSNYLVKHYNTKPEKLKLLYFLVKVAAVDGQINQNEVLFLRKLSTLLGLLETDLDSIILNYNEANQHKSTAQENVQQPYSKISEAFKTLAISENASWEEIKKAYRSLAKKYHPDMCKDQSDLEFTQSQKQFIRVQNAYEVLEQQK